MSELRLPLLSASPCGLMRSGIAWLAPDGAELSARHALAVCNLRVTPPRGAEGVPFPDEQNDLQVVLAPTAPGRVEQLAGLSRGGYQDLVSEGKVWEPGEAIATGPGAGLDALVLMGRRGFDGGESRGGLLPGWHERARASWEGAGGTGRFGTVLAYGTCEQTAVFRGDDMAFLSWFARAPGPAQVVWVPDERTVHSSAVVLQHLRRTPAEAAAITRAVGARMAELMAGTGQGDFPGLAPDAASGTFAGRWPPAQGLLFPLHLLSEAVGASPVLERTRVLTCGGVADQGPPDAIALSLGSEIAPHYRHRETGWIVAFHGFRFGQFIGPIALEWLRRDFEPYPRTVADLERDLAALAGEVAARTGAALLVQNLIASSASDRVPNYAWLGDEFATSMPVVGHEANLMLSGLTRSENLSVIDNDALAAELGVHLCPDRFHPARRLLHALQSEVQAVLRARGVPGF